jgi:hypothetical protein
VSLDELRADLKQNMANAAKLTSFSDVRDHFVDTLWPYLEAVLDVTDEIDDAVAELVDQQEDYLQPETAAIFAAVVQSGLQLAAELGRRAAGDAIVAQLISNHEQLCAQAVEVLGAVTMISADDDEETNDEETQADATTGAAHE